MKQMVILGGEVASEVCWLRAAHAGTAAQTGQSMCCPTARCFAERSQGAASQPSRCAGFGGCHELLLPAAVCCCDVGRQQFWERCVAGGAKLANARSAGASCSQVCVADLLGHLEEVLHILLGGALHSTARAGRERKNEISAEGSI